MLSIHNLAYVINSRNLFSNINITLLPSCILNIKGDNGSGKTTFLRIIAGIQPSKEGQISYNAKPIINLQKPYCTYIGHLNGFKEEFTVLKNLQFWSDMYNSTETLNAAIHYFNLLPVLHTKYYELSQGNKRKVAIARLLACQSDLWLLDEVDINLDDANKGLLYNLIISKANNGGIILMSSHSGEKAIKTAQNFYMTDYI